VKQAGGISPTAEITRPVMIERWLPPAAFSHAETRHSGEAAANARRRASSRVTSDVLHAEQESCVR